MKGTRRGDFSRVLDQGLDRVSAVQMQQGRAQLDSDWNTQAALFDQRLGAGLSDLVGRNAAPARDPGFEILPLYSTILHGSTCFAVDDTRNQLLPNRCHREGFTLELTFTLNADGLIFGRTLFREGRWVYDLLVGMAKDQIFVERNRSDRVELASTADPGKGLHLSLVFSDRLEVYQDGEALEITDGDSALLEREKLWTPAPSHLVFLPRGQQESSTDRQDKFCEARLWSRPLQAREIKDRSGLLHPEEIAEMVERPQTMSGDEGERQDEGKTEGSPELLGLWRPTPKDLGLRDHGISQQHARRWQGKKDTDSSTDSPGQQIQLDVIIGSGRYYVAGQPLENRRHQRFSEQDDLPDAACPTDPGSYLYYLDVWPHTVGVIEQPELAEPALCGNDTTVREVLLAQVRWHALSEDQAEVLSSPSTDGRSSAEKGYEEEGTVKSLEGQDREIDIDAILGEVASIEKRRPSLRASSPQAPGTALDNMLYRVEIHQGGFASDAPWQLPAPAGRGKNAGSRPRGQSGSGSKKSAHDHLHPAQGLFLEVVDEGRPRDDKEAGTSSAPTKSSSPTTSKAAKAPGKTAAGKTATDELHKSNDGTSPDPIRLRLDEETGLDQLPWLVGQCLQILPAGKAEGSEKPESRTAGQAKECGQAESSSGVDDEKPEGGGTSSSELPSTCEIVGLSEDRRDLLVLPLPGEDPSELEAAAATGRVAARPMATFKWAVDNGSVSLPVLEVDSESSSGKGALGSTADTATAERPDRATAILSPGVYEEQRLSPGSFVEVMDDRRTRMDDAANLWRVDSLSQGRLDLRSADGPTSEGEGHPFLRLWSQVEPLQEDGAAPDALTPRLTRGGLLPVRSADDIRLVSGRDLRVRFGEQGQYRRGDYWWIPARQERLLWPRTELGTPSFEPPSGLERERVPLATVEWRKDGSSEIRDLRRFFSGVGEDAVRRAGSQKMEGPLTIAGALVAQKVSARGGLDGDLLGRLARDHIVESRHLAPGAVTPAALAESIGTVPPGFLLLGPEGSSAEGYEATRSVMRFYHDDTEWVDRREIPCGPVGDLRAVVLAGRIYIFLEAGSVWELDPETGDWRTRGDWPEPRRAFALTQIDDEAHLMGGFDASNRPVGSHWIYTPSSDSWRQTNELKVPRGDLAAAAWKGQIYSFGGRTRSDKNRSISKVIEVFDPSTEIWNIHRSELPRATSALSAVTGVQGIHLIGGRRQSGYFGWRSTLTAEHWLCSPQLGRFRPLASLPTAREGVALALLQDQIYVMGGSAALGALNEHERYDLGQNAWRPQPSLHVPIAMPAAAGVVDQLWVIGAPGRSGPLVETRVAANSYILYRRLQPARDLLRPSNPGVARDRETETKLRSGDPALPAPDLGTLKLDD